MPDSIYINEKSPIIKPWSVVETQLKDQIEELKKEVKRLSERLTLLEYQRIPGNEGKDYRKDEVKS